MQVDARRLGPCPTCGARVVIEEALGQDYVFCYACQRRRDIERTRERRQSVPLLEVPAPVPHNPADPWAEHAAMVSLEVIR